MLKFSGLCALVVLAGQFVSGDPLQWMDAAVKGDVAKLRKLFEEDPSYLNSMDRETGRTAAIEAALNGQVKALEALIAWGADVVRPFEAKGGFSAFDAAVKEGHKDVALMLLPLINPNEETFKDGLRPIHRASEGTTAGHVEILKALLKTGKVSANDKSRESMTPVGYALRAISKTKFREPLKLASTALGYKRDIVTILLEHGADAEELSDDHVTALGLAFRDVAAYKQREKAVRVLPDFRGNFTADDRMLEAVQREDWAWVEVEIKERGANVNAHQKSNKQTALMTACLKGDLKTAKKLVEWGADATIGEEGEYTPMHGAGYQGHANIAKFLIEELKVDPNPIHKDGYRPLHRACWGRQPRHVEFVKYILSTGLVDPDTPTATGLTPLKMIASHEAYRNPHIAKVLVSFGADVSKLTEKETEILQLVSDDDFQTCPAFFKPSTSID
jgi:ankyrin repeat protein